jgi:hypothetical protein
MRIAQIVASSLVVAASGMATAQELRTIEVTVEESSRTMVLDCINPAKPSLKEVDRVLTVADPAQSAGLRTKLMEAAAEACAAREPKILVSRGANGGLTWKPMTE